SKKGISAIARETGKAKSTIYYIRNNPIYQGLAIR
ncbi:unnamed protein product, partial [marine sediment metagenome]